MARRTASRSVDHLLTDFGTHLPRQEAAPRAHPGSFGPVPYHHTICAPFDRLYAANGSQYADGVLRYQTW